MCKGREEFEGEETGKELLGLLEIAMGVGSPILGQIILLLLLGVVPGKPLHGHSDLLPGYALVLGTLHMPLDKAVPDSSLESNQHIILLGLPIMD